MKRLAVFASIFCALAGGPALAQSQKLADGFDGGDFAKSGGLYYKDNAEQKAGTVTFETDTVFSGTGALKLSVRALCPATDEDCSERAEIWERTKLRARFDEAVWYGFAVKFGEPIPDDDHRYLIAQWKREIQPGADGDFSPFLAFRLRNGKLFVTIESNYAPGVEGAKPVSPTSCANGTAVWLRPETRQMRALVAADSAFTMEDAALYSSCTDKIRVSEHNPLPKPDSGWIDFAVLSKPGPDGNGRIEIYANGKPIVTVDGMIGQSGDGLGDTQYFKFGPYRAGHPGEWTMFYDDFRRSPECTDVLKDAACPAGE